MKTILFSRIAFVLALLAGFLACERDFGGGQENPVSGEMPQTDSLWVINTSEIPDYFKQILNDSILKLSSETKKGGGLSNPIDNLLESETTVIVSEEGITTYSVAVAKHLSVEEIVKNPEIAAVIRSQRGSCQNGNSAESSIPVYDILAFSTGTNGQTGTPNLVRFLNYGNSIQTYYTNLSTGGWTTTWTPNPNYKNNHHHGNSGTRGWNVGGFLGNIWTGIKKIGNGIGSLFKWRKCKCDLRRKYSHFAKDSEGDDNNKDKTCVCEDEVSPNDPDENFSVIIPDSFFESAGNTVPADMDCECQYEKMTLSPERQPAYISSADTNYFDCSCQTNETAGVANLLELSTIEELYLKSNKELYAQICRFVRENNYSKEAVAFSKEAVKAVIEGGEVDFKHRILLDPSFWNNPRLKCVYINFFRTSNDVSGYLKSFLKDGEVGFLKLKSDDNFSENYKGHTSSTAITVSPKNYIIEIIFNADKKSDANVGNTSTILLGFALIHEMIHAEIYRKLLEVSNLPHVNTNHISAEGWDDYLQVLSERFYAMYEVYIQYSYETGHPTSIQRELMAQKYINTMSKALADFNKNKYPYKFYTNISWTGLEATKAYEALPYEKRIESYESIIQAKNETKECNN
ncbi:MAG: hypothetical protein Q4G08_02355 [Capnocytophaga sp.]|nr:hypothetical protein [Capnocytophaga sp.]